MHVARGRAAATPEGLFENGLIKCQTRHYAAAAAMFEASAALGHARAHAELSWLLFHGRDGVPTNYRASFQSAALASRLGCMHGSGVLAYHLTKGYGCGRNHARAAQLARASAAAGSRFGQYVTGFLHYCGYGGLMRDPVQSFHYFHLAASQGLDLAQCSLGDVYEDGHGVARDPAEAMRWWTLAGAQGNPAACFVLGTQYERRFGDFVQARLWYQRAHDAGHQCAAVKLFHLGYIPQA